MFCDRIVFFLPAIQRPVALETCCVIGIRLIGFVVESGVRQLIALSMNANVESKFQSQTSAGEGRWCGHVMAFCVLVPEDRRFSGFKTMSKLARRAAKVSISEPMSYIRTDL